MSSSKEENLPILKKSIGNFHPINQVKDSIIDFLCSLGFEIVEGPEVETEEFKEG